MNHRREKITNNFDVVSCDELKINRKLLKAFDAVSFACPAPVLVLTVMQANGINGTMNNSSVGDCVSISITITMKNLY